MRLDVVEAPDEAAAIEKAAAEFKIPATRLMAFDPPQGRDHPCRPSAKVAASGAPGRKDAGPREPRGIFCAAGVLSATPLTYSDFVVFCFAKPEDAEAFAARFGGKRLPDRQPAVTLNQAGDLDSVVHGERKVQNVSSCRGDPTN
jgi:hypothetical protein